MAVDQQDTFEFDASAESEEDAGVPTREQLQEAFVTGADWTAETLVTQLRKGNIQLDPAFQRREVWDSKRKSALIESIILSLPIPQIVLAEKKDQKNTYLVLDGKQRLITLRQFAVDPDVDADEGWDSLRLKGLTIRPDLNDETLRSLSDKSFSAEVNAFENHTIRTVVIRNYPDEEYLHRVFLRLNSGSVRLSPQELRQALHPGPFTEFLEEAAREGKPLQDALGIKKPDFRMRDNEILLRHIAFSIRPETYTGNLKVFLDETVRELNREWGSRESAVNSVVQQLWQAIEAAIAIFGKREAFSTFQDGEYQGRFNRAVFDVMSNSLQQEAVRNLAVENALSVREAFEHLSTHDQAFQTALTTTTKSKGATSKRFSTWADRLGGALEVKVETPRLDSA